MSLLGITLNGLSLLAMCLVAGVLVDDAIVEIENIVRHMRMGKTAYQAAIDAADEIGLAVVATTFSIVAVFLPVGLMPGVSGQFFKNFGLTVVVAVLLSLLVARMITPMVAAYFLHAKGHASHGEGPLMDRYMSVLRWSLDTRRAKELRARLGDVPVRFVYYLPALLIGVLAMFAFIFMPSPAPPGGEAPGSGFGTVVGGFFVGLIVYLIAWVLSAVVGAIIARVRGHGDTGFLAWARWMWKRLTARFRDHRVAMMG